MTTFVIPEEAKEEIVKRKMAGATWSALSRWVEDRWGVAVHRTTLQKWYDREVELLDEQQAEDMENIEALNQDISDNPEKYGIKFTTQSTQEVEKMETDWSKDKKDGKLNNMPFLGNYKKSLEKQYGATRSPRPDKNGYRNPPNRRIPDPES